METLLLSVTCGIIGWMVGECCHNKELRDWWYRRPWRKR